ncbi:MAG TPA: hypothetical protein P5205_12155 [Candidatus Paceibacterota bacterium]|nr:hypothetical protein [Verrucomicrobiota bacterium]HSA11113.1 hypothetical protein [Candidatus Paceibacterota bacterium]
MMSFLPLVRVWIWVSVLASVAGWGLSALGQLNRAGYAAFAVVAAIGIWLGRRKLRWVVAEPVFNWRKARVRFRRWLPACFLGLAFLVLLGGALYPPSNHTAMSYRTPRVLHWLAEGNWHWIHTPNYRMNLRCCGIEWLSAPVLLFMKSDRALFLINFVSFLLLPGLTYSVLTRLGVRRQVAWWWMWLLPTGYSFLLQAGSLGNDAYPAVYALAAVDFGLRAWESRRLSDLCLSILSAALLTGAKATNLPLLLPCGLVVLGLVPLLLRRPAMTFATVLLGATVSFLPTAALNMRYCGDWSGLNMEKTGMDMKSPVVGIWGNALLLAKNFVPPFLPQAGWWNHSARSIVPPAITSRMDRSFEEGYLGLGEMPVEDTTGIGFGISWLVVISVLAAWLIRSKAQGAWTGSRFIPRQLRWLLVVAPWGALLAYCMKSGIVDAGRLISAYYALLLPLLLISARQAEIVRRRWWRVMACGVVLLAVPVLVLTPGRPLWPAQTILSRLVAWKPDQRLLKRALTVYSVYDVRSDTLAGVRAMLPAGLSVVGFVGTCDDIDISLWRPFGSRRVKHILLSDSLEQIRSRQILYAVVGEANLLENNTTLAAWQARTGAQVVATTTATMTVSQGPRNWSLVRFPD